MQILNLNVQQILVKLKKQNCCELMILFSVETPALVTADSRSQPEEIVMCSLFFLQILDFPQYCCLTRHIELKHGVWIVVNSIKMNLSKHLVCGFLHLRMQDVEEMTLRFSHFYSFMWLVMDFSNVAFQHPAPAAFGQKGTKGAEINTEFC